MKKLFCILTSGLLLFAGTALYAADGAALYKACAGCHGADGSKKTAESAPLKGQSAEEILKKLNGYADGSYGGKQKAMMTNIAKKHSADDLKTLADYIGATLK